jgi:hypothetical protein
MFRWGGGSYGLSAILDALNLLNDTAFESVDTDVRWRSTSQTEQSFGNGNVFVDPRRAMLSVRFNLGR